MLDIWYLVTLLPSYRRRIASLLIVSTLAALALTAGQYFYKVLTNAVVGPPSGSGSDAFQAVTYSIVALVILRLAHVAFSMWQEHQANGLFVESVGSLRETIVRKLLGRSIDFFERTQAGDILDRFSAVGPISVWLMAVVEGALASTLQIIFALLILAFKLPVIAILMAFLLPFNVWESKRGIQATKPHREGWQKHAGRMSGILGELVANIPTIRSLDAEERLLQRYLGEQTQWRRHRDDLSVVHRISNGLRLAVNSSVVVASICIVAYGAVSGVYTPGDVALVIALSQTVLFGIGPITQILNQSGEVSVSAARLRSMLDKHDVAHSGGALSLLKFESLEFRNVFFRYPGAKTDALRNLCFTLERGHTLGIVGPSGAGKSTIIKLLLGFYTPSDGQILINGEALESYSVASVRAAFGVVLQDVNLLNMSIAENLRLARFDATDADIEDAARLAAADEFISSLGEGYKTIVGERGVKLSGGQKQRIAIARALLRQPHVFVFDEATSALDVATERLVHIKLDQAIQARTAIVIAHRLSSISAASDVIVLESGEITASGSQEELLASGDSFFARAAALQGVGVAPTHRSEDETAMHWKLRNA